MTQCRHGMLRPGTLAPELGTGYVRTAGPEAGAVSSTRSARSAARDPAGPPKPVAARAGAARRWSLRVTARSAAPAAPAVPEPGPPRPTGAPT